MTCGNALIRATKPPSTAERRFTAGRNCGALVGVGGRPAYPSDLSDEAWGLIRPVIGSWKGRHPSVSGHEGGYDMREIVNAILYQARTGCQWRYVPKDLVDRPKLGFSVPLHAWLTGALRDWAESLLAPSVIKRQGVLEAGPVAAVWRRYLRGDSSVDHRVWTLVMFQSWMEARGW